MTLSRRLVPLAGTLALALAGCGSSVSTHSSTDAAAPSSSSTSAAASSSSTSAAASAPPVRVARVVISGYAFAPVTVTVVRGGKVRFVNHDPINHTATANGGGFDTGTVAPGAARTVVLKKPGTYTYFCRFHVFMKATVIVR